MQNNYYIITGLIELPAAEEMFAAQGDVRPVRVCFEGVETEALESPALLQQVAARMEEHRDKTVKLCHLKYFVRSRQLKRVYIELESR